LLLLCDKEDDNIAGKDSFLFRLLLDVDDDDDDVVVVVEVEYDKEGLR
jgi:hypothetical protein